MYQQTIDSYLKKKTGYGSCDLGFPECKVKYKLFLVSFVLLLL